MFSNTANNSGGLPFSEADLKRALTSQEGRQLLSLLKRDGGDTLQKAINAVKSGNYEEAKEIVAPMLQDPEAAALLGKLNHG